VHDPVPQLLLVLGQPKIRPGNARISLPDVFAAAPLGL